MTNEKAIKVLQAIKKNPSRCVYLPDEYEALDLAIKALERPQGNLIKPLTELCDRYCKNCPVTGGEPNGNDCTDCIVTHIRGIMNEVNKE